MDGLCLCVLRMTGNTIDGRIKMRMIVIAVCIGAMTTFAMANGHWTTTDNSADQTSTPYMDSDNDTYCYGYSVWAWAKTRSNGSGAATDSTAEAYLPSQSCACTISKNTGEAWYSQGYYRLDIGWNAETCPGGDIASQNHDAPTNNTWTWTITGDCKATGFLDADNCDVDAGRAQVFFTADLDGANVCGDLDAEVTAATNTLDEDEEVTISGEVTTGGGGGGISWSPNQGDESTLNAYKSDSVGDTEALVAGSRFHIAGTSGTSAAIIDNAAYATVHAWTTLPTNDVDLANGGTHDSECNSQKPHGGHTLVE